MGLRIWSTVCVVVSIVSVLGAVYTLLDGYEVYAARGAVET